MITIRRILPGEVELYRRMRLASLQDAPQAFSSTLASALARSDQSWQEQAESAAQGAERATFFAFCEGIPCGIASLYRLEGRADTGEVLQVWLDPQQRGGGAARLLLEALQAWARENGYRRLAANITPGNSRAQRFYESLGFSIHGGADGAALWKELSPE